VFDLHRLSGGLVAVGLTTRARDMQRLGPYRDMLTHSADDGVLRCMFGAARSRQMIKSDVIDLS
jgi:hypothetical protein